VATDLLRCHPDETVLGDATYSCVVETVVEADAKAKNYNLIARKAADTLAEK
jgi:hypothetical protein